MAPTSTEILERYRQYLEEEGQFRQYLVDTVRAFLNTDSDKPLGIEVEDRMHTFSDSYTRRFIPFLSFLTKECVYDKRWRNDLEQFYAKDYGLIECYINDSTVKGGAVVSGAIHHFLKANESGDIGLFLETNPAINLSYVEKFIAWIAEKKPELAIPIDVDDVLERLQSRYAWYKQRFRDRRRKNPVPDPGPDLVQVLDRIMASAADDVERLALELIVKRGLSLIEVMKLTGKEVTVLVRDNREFHELLRAYAGRGKLPAIRYTKVELERLVNRCLRQGSGKDQMTLSQWRKINNRGDAT